MPECAACGDDVSMPFRCKFCEDSFCSAHRLPENHDCGGLRDYQDKSRQEGKVGYDVMQDDDAGETARSSITGGAPSRGWTDRVVDLLPASATVTVLALMAAAVALQYTVPGFVQAFGLYPDMSAFRQPWRLVTGLFLHGGILHLLVNSIVLWSFGRQLEQLLGTKRFLQVLLSAGIVSMVAMALSGILLDLDIPALGMSGALFGLVTFLAVVRPRMRVLAFFVIPLRIRHAVGIFAAVDLWNLAAQVLGTAGPYQLLFGPSLHVGSAAHLAGLLVGLVYGYAWRDRYRRRRPLSVWDMVR
ncbi:MAG: rhomboid family intramembrane serine protease [Candidatus Nanohaloarchaea archaeon]|nr:rhomboid family intramembrane serine protease [Candidatus Nanohaloarchaea archaeon]